MNFQQENQAKQEKEAQDNKYKQQQLLAPIRLQNEYNKENLKLQHGFNLEIFEKQSSLTKRIAIITASCTIIASIIGAIIGALFVFWLNTPQQQNQPKTQTQINQDISSTKEGLMLDRQTKTKQSAQGESSKNSLKKP